VPPTTILSSLDSTDLPDLADYQHLTDVALRARDEPGRAMYLAESSQVIRRALAAGHRPRSLLMAPRWVASMRDVIESLPDDVPVYVAEEDLLETITGFHLHRGALAAMHRPALPSVRELLEGLPGGERRGLRPGTPGSRRRVAVLEDVVDHTNVGAAFRAAAALGVDAVLVTPRCADPLYRRSVRVSMGTVFQVPWTRFGAWPRAEGAGGDGAGGGADGVDLLRELGYTVAALALSDDSVSLDELEADVPERLALVLGTEGDGLRAGTVAACDVTVRIPMAGGVDSLNVASAAAVAFWATR